MKVHHRAMFEGVAAPLHTQSGYRRHLEFYSRLPTNICLYKSHGDYARRYTTAIAVERSGKFIFARTLVGS